MSSTQRSARNADASRVSDHWATQSEKARASCSVWINNNIVADHIYRLISGGASLHWLPWFLEQYIDEKITFERSLSVCCGDGIHEIGLYQSGKVRKVCGFDISTGAIASAIATFRAASISPENYSFEVRDANDLKLQDSYDLILSSGAIHHVTNIEGLLSNIANVLTANGYLVVVEYVGPNRFQWTDRQIALVNGILRQLDPQYLKDGRRIELGRPSLDKFLAIDPSEAVRSEEIVPMLERYFRVEYLKYFNGTIVHPLYPLLNPELTNAGSAAFDSILRLILFFEATMVAHNVISPDFVFGIFRRKDFAPSKVPKQRRFVGFIDVFDSKGIAGWVVDTVNPLMPVDIDIYLDEDLYTTLRCDIFRPDLLTAGYVDARKGFQARFEADDSTVQPATARLLVHGSGELITSRRRTREN